MTRNYITVCNGGCYGKVIHSHIDFFKENQEVIVNYLESSSKLTLKLPTLDCRVKTHRLNSLSTSAAKALHVSINIPNGKYFICKEESDEDQVVIYIN